MNSENRRGGYYFFMFIVLITIDQLFKYLIRHFGGFYVCNTDISWGIHVPGLFFWFFWILIIVFLIFALKKRYFMHNTLYTTLILSGAVSNIIDRVKLGCVVDFIDLKFWPVFNIADTFIVLGVIFLLVRWKKL